MGEKKKKKKNVRAVINTIIFCCCKSVSSLSNEHHNIPNVSSHSVSSADFNFFALDFEFFVIKLNLDKNSFITYRFLLPGLFN